MNITVMYNMVCVQNVKIPDEEWDSCDDKYQLININLKDEFDEVLDVEITNLVNDDLEEIEI
jgi:negative regulator of sigma E activity